MAEKLNRNTILVSVVGILISTYALYVEMVVEARPDYEALCDIAEHAKCTRVLTSEYSKGFGLVPKGSLLEFPNCIYGIVFYCIIIILATYDNKVAVMVQMLLSVLSMISVAFLGYLLIFVLRDFCVVCVSTYFVNTGILLLTYNKFKYLQSKND